MAKNHYGLSLEANEVGERRIVIGLPAEDVVAGRIVMSCEEALGFAISILHIAYAGSCGDPEHALSKLGVTLSPLEDDDGES